WRPGPDPAKLSGPAAAAPLKAQPAAPIPELSPAAIPEAGVELTATPAAQTATPGAQTAAPAAAAAATRRFAWPRPLAALGRFFGRRPPEPPDWGRLFDRGGGLTGRVLLPGDPGWAAAWGVFNARFNVPANEPGAVVFAQSDRDVVNAVDWARRHRVPLRLRGGRHSYEGYSIGAGALVIDVSELKQVSFDQKTGLATVGAGVSSGELQEKLWQKAATIPAATGPSVGIAGLALGGGFGITSRKWGMTADNLVDVELVTADGRLIHANAREHPDLFWALRGGGGGNFGVATRFTFRTHPIDAVGFALASWDWGDFEKVVEAWQGWAPHAPDGMQTFLRLSSDRKLTLFAQYTPDSKRELEHWQDLLEPLLKAAKPASLEAGVVPFIDVARRLGGVAESVNTSEGTQVFKSGSAFAKRPLDAEAVARLKRLIEESPQDDGVQPNMVQLLAAGGAVAKVPSDATAAFDRDALFVFQYDAYWGKPEEAERNIDWVRGLRRAFKPFTRGAYVNYQDSDLKNPLLEYYGKNLGRLIRVKRRYDPGNLFRFPQSIPLEPPSPASRLPRPLRIAHRGAAAMAPEETAIAQELARNAGADFLEADVQLTSDGVPVLVHDATFKRTTDVAEKFPGRENNPVGSFTWAEIQELDAGSFYNRGNGWLSRHWPLSIFIGAGVMRLERLLGIADGGTGRKPGVYLEAKFPAVEPEKAVMAAEAIVATLRRQGWDMGRVVFESFSPQAVRRFKELAPEAPATLLIGYLYRPSQIAAVLDAAQGCGADIVGPFLFPWLYRSFIEQAHLRGLAVHPWIIDDVWPLGLFRLLKASWLMRWLIRCGADGFFTDYITETTEK
ncbi:MAG: FAD-binding protein, partial [Elusimicrobia bacterium]|nr:FAD-binding protein [Elusimicrobiota bacterium]